MRERFLSSSSRLPVGAESAIDDPDRVDAHKDPRWLTAYVDRVAREPRQVAWSELPAAIIHGDLRADKLTFRDGSPAAVLDFDLATGDARVADLPVTVPFSHSGETRPACRTRGS